MSKQSELVKGMFVEEGNVSFVKHRINFNVAEFSKMLIAHKDVFEANKVYGRIEICESKAGKLYAALSTWKPTAKPQTAVEDHLAGREVEQDLPF